MTGDATHRCPTGPAGGHPPPPIPGAARPRRAVRGLVGAPPHPGMSTPLVRFTWVHGGTGKDHPDGSAVVRSPAYREVVIKWPAPEIC